MKLPRKLDNLAGWIAVGFVGLVVLFILACLAALVAGLLYGSLLGR